ncbi:MAG: carbohydrate binding domain-containing protein [Saprospiraceae bacterium]|nr:carbohydrate binding domain-containing protein [Saprospiraceae bacterium]
MKSIGILAFMFLFLAKPQRPGDTILIRNPSFEDEPGPSKSPKGWQSFTPGCTPDILPGAWGVQFAAQDGRTCVGLVTREDGTSEDISQGLQETLKGGTCYTFSIYLAHSAKYVGYNSPVRLRVFGGAKRGGKEMLLASSPLIDHSEWKNYKFQFVPDHDMRHITFEAWFGPGTTFKYKGNIILDNCSNIEKCDRA